MKTLTNALGWIILLSTLSTPVHAATFTVPGDFADLQQALDDVPAGSTIVVQGGPWGPLVISQAVTIVGAGLPLIEGDEIDGIYVGPISLAGPGSGDVVLAGIEVGDTIDGLYVGSAPGIAGGGFDSLQVRDAVVNGPESTFTFGFDSGTSAISVTIPFVVIERCDVAASSPGIFDCADSGPDGVAAIVTTGTLLVLDSQVTGGGGASFFFFGDCGVVPCPETAIGGPGVVCNELLVSDSVIAGGEGAVWGSCATGYPCCQAANGPDIVAGSVEKLGSTLGASGPPVLGEPWQLAWTTPGPVALLYVASGPMPPILLAGRGYVLLHLETLIPLGAVPSPGGLTIAVPDDPDLLGVTLGFQVLDATTGLSRPVYGTLLP